MKSNERMVMSASHVHQFRSVLNSRVVDIDGNMFAMYIMIDLSPQWQTINGTLNAPGKDSELLTTERVKFRL